MPDCLASVPDAVAYTSWVKALVMLLVTVPWLYLAPWVHKDAHRVHASGTLWGALVLGAGALGALVCLLVSLWPVGPVIYVVLAGAMLVVYAVYRDKRVEPEDKVLRADFFRSIFSRGRRGEKVDVVTHLKVYDAQGKIILAPDGERADADEAKMYNLVQDLLYDMMFRRASEADLWPGKEQARLRFLVDGVLVDRPPLPLSDSDGVIQYLKSRAGMDPEDRRRPQQGQISIDTAAGPSDMTLTTAGTTGGQRIQFKIVLEAVQTSLNELGLSDDLLERVRKMNGTGSGLILVTGRPRAGLTSTLYSLLREHDAFIRQLVTLEAKPDVDMENITQVAYGKEADLPGALAGVIRRDPDVVMVDRCPDSTAAEAILQAARLKLILLGLHALDAFTGLAKWVKVCGDPAAGAADLRGVLCQVLLRKLCTACREAYRPDPQFVAKANLSGEKIGNFYRPPTQPVTDKKGRPIICSACQGTGYVGRIAAFELLEVTDEIRRLVADGTSLGQIKAACRKNKMLYIQEQALRKVIQGITSVKEVIRVTQRAKKK